MRADCADVGAFVLKVVAITHEGDDGHVMAGRIPSARAHPGCPAARQLKQMKRWDYFQRARAEKQGEYDALLDEGSLEEIAAFEKANEEVLPPPMHVQVSAREK